MINAASMDQRVTLRSQSATADALGQRVDVWTDVATVWARVRPAKGREYTAAGAEQAAADVEVDIRHRTDVTTALRLVWRGVTHEILAVTEPLANREYLRLHCRSDA